MRGVSRISRGVVMVSLVMSLAAPMQARGTSAREEVGRGKRDVVSIVMKWIARAFGDGLVDPWPVKSTGDGLVDPHP